jgi:ATP-dependent RNA helicase DDX3X
MERRLFGEKKSGINFKIYEDIPVEASGNNCPEKINTFEDAKFEALVMENVGLCGYETPTPIQKWSIPIAQAGRDLMACAQTGSGKTAAFLLPILANLLSKELPIPAGGFKRGKYYPSGLVLAPTRELVVQILQEAEKFTYRTSIVPVAIYGGTSMQEMFHQLDRGCDLVIACPGRLADLTSKQRMSLECCNYLVFDEADRMLDMGFEPQIREIVEKTNMPQESRQTLMFSATFPKMMQKLAADFLQDYIFLQIGTVGSTTNLITQKVQHCQDNDYDKRELLRSILPKCEGLTLIFVETKRGANDLERWLGDMEIDAASIHGDKSQPEREAALAYFRKGRCPVLVATDVASRGLDIPDVRYVINYDMPSNIEDYTHRIGRTGRCGATGTAIGFMTEKNRNIAQDLYKIMSENKQEVPQWLEQWSRGGGGGYGGYGGYRGGNRGGHSGGGGHFGGGGHYGGSGGGFQNRDFRQKESFQSNSNAGSSSSSSGNSASGPVKQQNTNRPQSAQVSKSNWGGGYGSGGSYSGGGEGSW